MSITNSFLNIINRTPHLLRTNGGILNLIAKCSTTSFYNYDKDPEPHFINPEIQKLLKSMTRIDLSKVYKRRTVPENTIEYKFMTTEEIEEKFIEAANKAEERLQMPPVVKILNDEPKLLSNDSALDGFADSKFVITDITYGVKQSKRKIIIREIDGTLHYASQDIRKRMNQIYFPLDGRQICIPKMFESENLKRCLDEQKYEFILDRLCVQYEPFEKDYHEISSQIYQHIIENKQFDVIRSTRHFGPMVFFLAWHKIIDDLLYDMIKRDFLRNGVELIALMYQLNEIVYDKEIHRKLEEIPESKDVLDNVRKTLIKNSDDIHEEIKNAIGKSANDFIADEICLGFIETYVKKHGLKKVPLELSIQTFRETNDEKKKLYEGLKKAHGVN